MATQHTDKADWKVIDPAELPEAIATAYNGYKAAYKYAKEMREDFENAMIKAANLPSHRRLVFGYNFGKLSIAVVANDKPTPTTKGATSLADFLAAAKANGDHH